MTLRHIFSLTPAALAVLVCTSACGQIVQFNEVQGTSFTPVRHSALEWADVDNDGDQDVLITGQDVTGAATAKLYLNDGAGNFTEMPNTPFQGVFYSAVGFSDVNGDGSVDVLITGQWGTINETSTKLYLNDGGANFTEVLNTPFPGLRRCAIEFGDLDNDGDEDLVLSGYFGLPSGSNSVHTSIYFNDGNGLFSTSSAQANPVFNSAGSAVGIADVNGDGWNDVVMMGWGVPVSGLCGGIQFGTLVLVNQTNGSFVQSGYLPANPRYMGALAIADFNNDGKPDFAATGFRSRTNGCHDQNGSQPLGQIGLHNGTSQYAPTNSIANVGAGSLSVSDVDGDGDVDLFLTGATVVAGGPALSILYLNDGLGNFTEHCGSTIGKVRYSASGFADIDGDGDEDLLVVGDNGLIEVGVPNLTARLYRNDFSTPVGGVVNVTTCAPFTWINDIIYTESTSTPQILLPGAGVNGCDSLVTLNLTIIDTIDGCGECLEGGEQNPNWNQSCADCAGVPNGTATLDACGVCTGGSTGITPCAPGCTNPEACNYNPEAGFDDGTCFFACNDTPQQATWLEPTLIGSCNAITADLNDAQTIYGGSFATPANDLWYRFTAITSGVRISLTTVDFDAVIELFDANEQWLDTEDVAGVNSGERLNFGGLTAGEDYIIRITSNNVPDGAAPFSLCVQWLPDTRIEVSGGATDITRSLCGTIKAKWVPQGGEDYTVSNYIFNFSTDGFEATAETGSAFTVLALTSVQAPYTLSYQGEYTVTAEVELLMTNGGDEPEVVRVKSSNAVQLNITEAPLTTLRPANNLTNAGPLFPNAFIWATPWVCTVHQWEWEFTNAAGGLPITFVSANSSRVIRLSDVDGLAPGTVYNVRVRPLFTNEFESQFGPVDQIAILGALGMAGDITTPLANTEIDERVEETITATGAALYPNPNRGDFVNINIANVAEGVDRVIFDLYDLTGKRVMSQQIAVAGATVNAVLLLNGLANGMYIANIIVGDEVHTERIAVQK